MFNEEMHVLAPQAIRSMRELDGKTVAVDTPDSSTFVTAINVFDRLGIRPHLLYIEPRVAIDMLRKGDIDAIVAVEGKPVQWLAQLNDPSLHLVPVDYDKSLRDEYLPAQLTSEDYPNLISGSDSIDTIAGEAVLASYNWPAGTDRYRRLSLLVDSLFSHIAQLQQPPFHPKWAELAPMAPMAGWIRFKAAQDWIDRNSPVASAAETIPPPTTIVLKPAVLPRPRPLRAAAVTHVSTPPRNDNHGLFHDLLQWRIDRGPSH
jgi:TRAP-type uncharacterized transport system substrate-binding protein